MARRGALEKVTFALLLMALLVIYLSHQPPMNHGMNEGPPIMNEGTPNVLMDPYVPPSKTDGYRINIETRGLSQDYSQLGILTKDDKILPLMGRRLMADKWQYYSISNTGVINTKLPLSVKGRSCTGEYGCDPLMNGDAVYVEGYKQTFVVTLYETTKYQYLPY